jgi:hypothetical protein
VRDISHSVALAVALEAQKSDLAPLTDAETLAQNIDGKMWRVGY